jgi:prevent-host-death family protein
MQVLSLSEFRAHASEMLDLVEKGETVRILRHGKPVAELVPLRAEDAQPPSYLQPFEPVMRLPEGYSAVSKLIDERRDAGW